MAPIKIVALGSSFASGPGIEPITDQNARRSANNYANILAKKLNANLVDLTVAGATLSNVLDTPQQTGWGWKKPPTFPPQLSNLPSDADIITITAGGNDLGYSGGMIKDSLIASLLPPTILSRWPISYLQSLSFPSSSSKSPPTPTIIITATDLAQKFTTIIDKIHTISPKATIYLVKYVRVFGPATRPEIDTPLSKAAISKYMELSYVLNEAYDIAAATAATAAAAERNRSSGNGNIIGDVEVIEMDELSKGYELGSLKPWVTGFEFDWGKILGVGGGGGAPYHPNAEAHVAVAEELVGVIKRKQGD